MANMLTALVHSNAACVPGPHLHARTLADAAGLILSRD
jgi:hypothetical protein